MLFGYVYSGVCVCVHLYTKQMHNIHDYSSIVTNSVDKLMTSFIETGTIIVLAIHMLLL